VTDFVRPFNHDGKDFIWQAADLVYESATRGEHVTLQPKRARGEKTPLPEPVRLPIPSTISHFVMNLPGSALSFVHHYKGVYAGREALFSPHTDVRLPLVHVHCFSQASDKDDVASVNEDICQRLYDELGVQLKHGNPEIEGEVSIHWVRKVAPNKTMCCASFRIPAEVAFAPRTETSS
jgi:tRNA (guanine37-N1)-methyltransferase